MLEQDDLHHDAPGPLAIRPHDKEELELQAAVASLRDEDFGHVNILRIVHDGNDAEAWTYYRGLLKLWIVDGPEPVLALNWSNIWMRKSTNAHELTTANFELVEESSGWVSVEVTDESAERVELAKRIVGKRDLSVAEMAHHTEMNTELLEAGGDSGGENYETLLQHCQRCCLQIWRCGSQELVVGNVKRACEESRLL